MFKKITISLTILLIILNSALIANTLRAAPEVNTAAVAYLKTQPQDAWITMALAATSESDIPTSHLTSVSGDAILVTDYAKAILALAAIGKNPATFGNTDYVKQLKTFYNNNQFGNTGLINDDIWSILALASISQAGSSEAINAKNFIIANQNSDGGWGHIAGGSSDTNDTASAIMALLETGLTSSDTIIANAINYLKSAQNGDAGFPYDPNSSWGTDSDSNSDAWVIAAIYKLGQNPATWTKSGGNPISHLKSLQDDDGGFWWVKPGTSDYNNKASTAHAVIALNGKSHPLNKIILAPPTAEKFAFRIEGSKNTICEGETQGPTALDIVKNAATLCGFTYEIIEYSLGPYLKKINDDQASGAAGWLYFVNNAKASTGAGSYTLKSGDKVIWCFGEDTWELTQLSLPKTEIATGESTEAIVTFLNTTWQALEGAVLKAGEQQFTTDAQGKVSLTLADGYYKVYAEKNGYIRSNSFNLKIGGAERKDLGLRVNITQGSSNPQPGNGSPKNEEDALSFSVDVENIDFGDMAPGQSKTQNITITNNGSSNLHIEPEIAGASVFQDNLFIAQKYWTNFKLDLIQAGNKQLGVSLGIPSSYSGGTGEKQGTLTFWAMKVR